MVESSSEVTNDMHDCAEPLIRVVVVDDSSFVRKSLIRMFEESGGIEVVGTACDGESALALIKELAPDVVTMDVKMPVLDGLAALERIMEECPTPVVMLSCCTGRGAEQTIRALELGAVDFVDKCSVGGPMEIGALSRELIEKIRVAARVRVPQGKAAVTPPPFAVAQAASLERTPKLVLIGTSTGGPAALTSVLGALPADFPAPVLVVQHMPPGFTAPLAERLNRICRLSVKEAEDGELLLPGHAYIAPGGQHLVVRRLGDELAAGLAHEPCDAVHRPSVDVLFRSAAALSGRDCLAFVLTGMGSDGVAGALEIKKKGGKVFVESAETSVVYGMPGSVAAAIQVDGSLPIDEVGARIAAEVLG